MGILIPEHEDSDLAILYLPLMILFNNKSRITLLSICHRPSMQKYEGCMTKTDLVSPLDSKAF